MIKALAISFFSASYVPCSVTSHALCPLRVCNACMVVALAGNKSDLLDARKVTSEEAQAYAQENGLFFMETSAKTETKVKEIFYEIARRLPRVQPTQNPTGMVIPDRAMDRAVSPSCCA
ncbi:unnamed protein product [Brassica oleracea]|uniref:Uncharacterized protein n=1 Tax=Brassica oleracea TaxID=3712 RepID=A0A3P6BAL4_BRAOL|nr:unnamed protein product [Brassica oleracea]